MELYYLYHIPEPKKKLYFIEMEGERAKFTELRSNASIFNSRESAISMQEHLNIKYGLDLQIEKRIND